MSTGSQSEMISLTSIGKQLEDEVSNATQLVGTKTVQSGHLLTIAALLAYQSYCNILKSVVLLSLCGLFSDNETIRPMCQLSCVLWT
jgi:hypothetical protein